MPAYLKLKESNCKNCHKCIRHCPVKSISFSNNQANIIAEECILCGECFVTCPQNAKSIRDDLPKVKQFLRDGYEVCVSVAPSWVVACNGVPFGRIQDALIKLGFAYAEETAVGATIVKKRYEQIMREGNQRVIISTCCHSVNMLVQKYYPEAAPHLAKVVSPMIAHGMSLKKNNPERKVVFIGPCISKKAEAEECSGAVDCVLTFEDLSLWLKQEHITLSKGSSKPDTGGKARIFPTTGGILDSMDLTGIENYSFMAVDGVKNCISALEDIKAGNIERCFIEMSACAGSCICGPVLGKEQCSPISGRIAVRSGAGSEDFSFEALDPEVISRKMLASPVRRIKLGNKSIQEVLQKMGKTLPEHEMNCGSCGYESCRDKAEAVLRGKAEITMCLPYLMARAESFSDNIINNTPNGIIVLNRSMEIQQINNAAERLMNIQDEKTVLGRHVVCVLDPSPFIQAISNSQNIYDQHVFLVEYGKHIKLTVVTDTNFGIIIGFMRDVTKENAERSGKEESGRKAIEIADKVIEKHMRTVQEIASLLGETTAETKVALDRLKETVRE